MTKEAYLVWKVPKEREIDVGDFHDVGIYPTGELMAVCDDVETAQDVIKHLEKHSPSERFGDSMEDAPYEFTTSIKEVEKRGEIFIYWKTCSQCGYETAAHGRVSCPDCGCGLTSAALAGSIIDDREELP